MRILSFQPTSTEMAYALGAGRAIVGVSHECTWPPAARKKPVVSTSVIDPETMSSGEIDAAVVAASKEGRSLYRIDRALVEKLQPDLLLTQSLCEVCATSPSDLREVLQLVKPKPKVLALHAHDFEGMFGDLRELAELLGKDARPLERALRRRIEAVLKKTRKLPKRRVFCMEWLDPVFASGHWVPEMVEMAGGHDPLASKGKESRRIEWSAVVDAAPDVLILMPCGLSRERTLRELPRVTERPGWTSIPAVRSGEVYHADGPSYFNGGGVRLVDGLEILAEILHPEIFPRRRRAAYSRILAPKKST
ncbi:MAG TPA: cobalamin-binding protein [Planctomycetota bacterium]|jgi:iron complex transport system substrate-binding protein|nr:cobalamin-binding protein [Planctomycetota bacterium]